MTSLYPLHAVVREAHRKPSAAPCLWQLVVSAGCAKFKVLDSECEACNCQQGSTVLHCPQMKNQSIRINANLTDALALSFTDVPPALYGCIRAQVWDYGILRAFVL